MPRAVGAMTIIVEAVYEDGVLKLEGPLPICERERVQVVVRRTASASDQTRGMIGWLGSASEFDGLFKESELDLEPA